MNPSLETLRAEIEALKEKFEADCQKLLESNGAEAVVVCLVNSLIGTRCFMIGPDELKNKLPEILRTLSHDLEEKLN
jgi:hypothetical protein